MLNSVADWQGRTLTEARLSKLGDVTSSHGIVAVWSASIRGLVDAEEKKLGAGKSTSFVVLQLQRDLTAARSEEIRALAEYNKAQAALAQREGATLQRAKINVTVK